MTTYARKIAEAVRDAAALEANKCYIKSTSLFELGVEAAKAVRALDLDAIIAGVAQLGREMCPLCGGTGLVTDGEIIGIGGEEFESGSITCVKDCPNCTAPQPQAAEPKGLTELLRANHLRRCDALSDVGFEIETEAGAVIVLTFDLLRALLANGE